MAGDRIAPLKSERIQHPLPDDPELAALLAGFLAALAETHGRGPRSRPRETRSGCGSAPQAPGSPPPSPACEGPAER